MKLKTLTLALLSCIALAVGGPLLPASLAAPAATNLDHAAYTFTVPGKASLLRIGASPMNVTKEGRDAAQTVADAIEKKDAALAEKAIKLYDELIPRENLGGDYTAMQWLCRDLMATLRGEKPDYDPLSKAYQQFFSTNNYEALKEYLKLKYGLLNFDPKSLTQEQKERRGLLEDYIMFMNPCREQWEMSDKCLALVGLKPGEKVLDIGCGIGYYTYKMAAQVGPEGVVYAIDTNEKFIDFINNFSSKQGLRNIRAVASAPNDIKVADQADAAFICSLYHVIYGWSTEPSRKAFLQSIKRALKPNGRLVIVDNLAADGRELHSCYVDRHLVASQLYFYGFREELYAEISPVRYLSVFKLAAPDEKPLLPRLPEEIEEAKTNHNVIEVRSGNSLVHIGSLDSYDITPGGIEAARLVLDTLQTKNLNSARQAIERYNQLIPKENFGGEFTALQWFCEYQLASPEQQQAMLKDSLVRAYYNYLAGDDYSLLKDYVKFKYKLAKPGEKSILGEDVPQQPLPSRPPPKVGDTNASPTGVGDARSKAVRPQQESGDPAIGRNRRAFLEDFILFNNPKRPQWEQTDKIMSLLDVKPGQKIADIGCGGGYYTFRFSKLVGNEGRVYAMDVKEEHLEFINEYAKQQGITNVTTVKSSEDDLSLKDQVDWAYMCSLYHIIYGMAPEKGRQAFIQSFRRALKPGGKLVIVDNGPVEDNLLPYHGPYLAKELAIAQLERYGFKFLDYHQIIPQRYLLVFEKVD